MRKVLVSGIAVVLILGAALGLASAIIASRGQPEQVDSAPPRTHVRTFTVQPADVTETIHGYGQVVARRRAELAAEVGGKVIWRHPELEVGQPVREGIELVKIDRASYEQAVHGATGALAATRAEKSELEVSEAGARRLLAEIEAQLAIAENELERLEGLTGAAAPSESELDAQRMQVFTQRSLRHGQQMELDMIPVRRERLDERIRSQTATLEQARIDLARTTIVAPFSGSVATVSVELGEVLMVGQEVAVVVSLDDLEARVKVPASQQGDLELGRPAVVYQESNRAVELQGTVARLAPEIDSGNRTVGCFITLHTNGEGTVMRPGAFVVSVIPGLTHENVIAVPREAFVDELVYVVREGRSVSVRPRIGRELTEVVIVESGLQPGDEVILTNLEALFDGLPVTTGVESSSPAADPDGAGR